MGRPGGPVGEEVLREIRQGLDDRAGEVQAPHVVEGGIVADQPHIARAEMVEKVQSIRITAAEMGEIVIADGGAISVAATMTGTGVVNGDPGGAGRVGLQDLTRLGDHRGAGAFKGNWWPFPADDRVRLAERRQGWVTRWA